MDSDIASWIRKKSVSNPDRAGSQLNLDSDMKLPEMSDPDPLRLARRIWIRKKSFGSETQDDLKGRYERAFLKQLVNIPDLEVFYLFFNFETQFFL